MLPTSAEGATLYFWERSSGGVTMGTSGFRFLSPAFVVLFNLPFFLIYIYIESTQINTQMPV